MGEGVDPKMDVVAEVAQPNVDEGETREEISADIIYEWSLMSFRVEPEHGKSGAPFAPLVGVAH